MSGRESQAYLDDSDNLAIYDVNTIAKKGDAKDGLVALEDSGIGSGALFPHEILTRTTPPDKVAAAVAQVKGIHGTVAPDSPSWRRDGTALVNALQNQRQSVSGVNLDEEMTNLITYQRGYQASARAMNAMDDMLDQLINRTGRVGL